MEKLVEFDDIRPYHDEELPQIYEELIEDHEFRKVIENAYPEISFDIFADEMRQCKSKGEFQKKFCYDYIWNIANTTTDGLKLDDASITDKEHPYTYISNHRDIVLDSSFLSILLLSKGRESVEIAIGDNLLFLPWIKKLVRINKSFIVQRALNMRQMLESSIRLSKYMHYVIKEKKESLWIAQREGRAKDSNDRTQESVLKMLTMGGEGDIIDSLKSLFIVPLAISYEYDPCDYLKAQEFQLKRDMPDYKKTFQDDLKNMKTGMFGYKGKVMFRTGNCLNSQLDKLNKEMSKQELYMKVSSLIDREIHRNYTIYPVNYIASDLLLKENQFTGFYTEEEKKNFEVYLSQQIDKVEIVNKDIDFLRNKMLFMYANPLNNYLAAIHEN